MHTTKWKVMSSRSTFYPNLTASNLAQYLIGGPVQHYYYDLGMFFRAPSQTRMKHCAC